MHELSRTPCRMRLLRNPASLFLALLASSFVHTATQASASVSYLQVNPGDLVQGANLTQAFEDVEGSLALRLQQSGSRPPSQESCPQDVFAVLQATRYLHLLRSINTSAFDKPECVSNGSEYFSTVQTFACFVVGEGPMLSYSTTIIIHVLPDLQNLEITFPLSSYTATVVENQTNALVAIQEDIRAITTPVEGLAAVQYEILNGASCFAVLRETVGCDNHPKILTTKPLQANTSGIEHIITLKAFIGPHSALTNISIEVINTNLHPPAFHSLPHNLTISESTTIGTVIYKLQATDPDSGVNGKVRYRQSSQGSPTTINPVTGELYLVSPLNYETTAQLDITIVAFDSAVHPMSATTTLTIFVTDSNEQSPAITITNQLQSVLENTPTNTPIASVLVADEDSSDFSLSLASRYCTNCFILANELIQSNGSHTYDILVNGMLNYESFPNGLVLMLVASDNDNNTRSTTVTLKVELQDVNEEPFFPATPILASVREKDPVGSHVVLLQAQDEDTGNNGELSYTITSGNELNWFSVNPQVGLITLNNLVNSTTAKSVSLGVTVRDNGSPQLMQSATVVIAINDLDDHSPVFSHNEFTITVSETWNDSTPLFDFTATDIDTQCSGAITYAIFNSEPPIFTIDAVSGLLFLQSGQSLDYESFRVARVMVQARSQGDNPNSLADATLVLNVTNEDNNSPILDPSGCPCWITENQQAPVFCPPLTAHDRDSANSILQFNIISGNELGNFIINSSTGVVSTTSALDHEEQDSYALTISVQDQAGHTSNEEVMRIVVVDINDAPIQFTSSSPVQLSVPVDLPVGGLVGSLSAPQKDAGYNALTRYDFTQQCTMMTCSGFTLDPLSGKLYLNQGLQAGQTFSFTVRAMDLLNNNQQSELQVTVIVGGPNNLPPQFFIAVDQLSIPDNLMMGTSVIRANASDSSTVQYSFVGESSLFSINSANGDITLTNVLTNMVEENFVLNISATDNGSPMLTSYMALHLTVYSSSIDSDLVQNPGVGVCHYVGTVIEGTTTSVQLLTLAPTISGNSIQYSILESEFSTAFQVDGNILRSTSGNGQVFDRSARESVFIVLRALYSPNFHLCAVSVAIADINNNGPVFSSSSYSIEIYHVTPIGSSIFQFTTTDEDIGTNAQANYMLNESSSIFSLEQQTGILRTQAMISLTPQQHTLTVIATDALDATKTAMTMLTITILNTINNAPFIPVTASTITIPETQPLNVLHDFQATDNDAGFHGEIRYCIASGNVFNNFVIGPDGELELSQFSSLDYETQPHTRSLVVVAYDPSPNPRMTSSPIEFIITDTNDEPPTFLTPGYTAVVKEGTPSSTPILKVMASDKDEGTNGELRYSFSSDSQYFSIEETTGQISANNIGEDLRTTNPYITLTVLAKDQGNPSLSANTTVNVTILDQNSLRPVIISHPSSVSIMETELPFTEFTRVRIMETIGDIDLNSEVRLWINNGNNNGIFFLNEVTGALSLNRKLDYEEDSHSFTLTIRAIDLGAPEQLAVVDGHSLTITLTNVNDNYPDFTKTVYNCSLTEGTTIFTIPCKVTAVDADLIHNTVSYTIVDGNLGDTFEISSTSGTISVASGKVIDHETVSQYSLIIRATDSEQIPLSSTAVVIVSVQDVGDSMAVLEPQLSALTPKARALISNISIAENTPTSTLLFRVHAEDMDNNNFGQIQYDLLTANTPFAIAVGNGEICLTNKLDYESASSHTFEVLATGTGGAGSAMYTVHVIDVDQNSDQPYFQANSPVLLKVSRSTPVGTYLTTLTANDRDTGRDGTISYYIIGGSGYGYFRINTTSGEIFSSYLYGGVTADHLSISVAVYDAGSMPKSNSYEIPIILVENPQAKPFFVSPLFTVTISGTDTGKIFSYVSAHRNGEIDTNITYSIKSAHPLPFTISNTTGALSLVNALDSSDILVYNFTVEAAVQGTTSTSSALVIVHVFEETQLRPVFPTDIDFNSRVFQNAPSNVNLTVARVFATTVTRVDNFMFSYELQTDGPFSIVPSTGEIYLTANLASTTTYQLTVTARNANGLNNQKNVTVTSISQLNPNTQHPTFSAISYAMNISEDAEVGTSIFSSNANDEDSNVLFYSFTKAETTPSAHRDFSIHPNTGNIYIAHTLDREDQAAYTIIVEAWDGTNAAVTTLMVTITDINDNIPSFIHQQSEFNINEDSSIGSMVGSVQAEDHDENPSGLTYYFADFLDPMSENLFNITANGEIIIAGSLDREKQSVHVLTVAVRDSGSPPFLNYTRVTINIDDANDNIPEIIYPLPPIVVSEDAAMETIVFSLSAFDPDLNENGLVEYTLQPNSLPFSINSTTGEITVTAALNYETTPHHILNIIVQNMNGQSSNVQLNVSVLNIIDTNPSLYQTQTVQLAENLPPNTFVVAVAEQNPPHPVTYSIISGNTHNHFYMEPFSGIVRTARPLDRESIASYSLTVRGSFNEAHFSDFTVSIEVTDENDNPPVPGVTTFSFSVPENTALSNQQVFHLNFTDADIDTNAQIVRVEILNSVAADWFRIDTNGEATLLKPLDREMQSVYNFETVVIDDGTPQQISSIFISVTVEDSNDNFPQFSEDEYRVVINAPVLVNTSLFTISANDRDEGVYGTVEYTLAVGNSTGQFVIDTSTGVVSIIDNFDLQPYYNLTAIATDGGGQQTTVNVYVAVKYCSFANLTIYPSVYNLDAVENITIGHILVSLSITDFGQPGTFEYMITTPNSFFGITTSGNIFVSKELDREMQATHRIAVQARDTSSSSLRIAQANIIVTVLDINDNNPVFSMSPYAAIVVDTDKAGKEVTRVRASDLDLGSNSAISYHLVQDPLNYFIVDSFSGAITIKRDINPAIMDTTSELIITARDDGHPQLSTNVSVLINIVNSNAPNFSQPLYSVDISESAMRHDLVLMVQATAKAQNSILIYSIETNDPLFPLAISNNGRITVNDIGLDYERTTLYSFGVRVTDTTTSLSAQALVQVNVLDYNDESPSFSEALYQITEAENASIDKILLTASANDQDSPPNAQLTYSLPPNSYPGLFVINSQDGTVRTNGTLDYEMHQSYQFMVQAVDSGSPPLTGSATIRITVTNINDNPPVFSIPNPPSVSESSSPGTTITYIQASDPDGDSLTYGLFPSIGYENFQIGSNGLLSLNSITVSLTEPEYQLNISAFDGVHITTSIVTVTIIDVNDHSPMFNSTVYNATVVENSPAGIYLTTVFATDEDRGINAEITYTGHLCQFNVHSTTGVVTTGSCGSGSSCASCIDRETTPVYNLFVVARDGGSRADSATVVITVLDENDNSPVFVQDSYAASVSESVDYGFPVLQVSAKDADNGPNGSVSYSIDGGSNLFTITSTGWIQTIGIPNFEEAEQHVLQVVAMDMGDPMRQSNPVQVTIHVVNQADVNPTFLNSTYNASIPENATFHTVVFETQIANSECVTPAHYSIVQQQHTAFSIGSSNGVVTVVSILDREKQDFYQFQIQVQCSILSNLQFMALFGFAQVNIMIEDVNEPPEFSTSDYIQSIEENSPINTTLTNVMLQADDGDLGENGQIRFRIVDDMTIPFDIRPESGVLFVTGELDHESDPEYFIKVVAYDLGTPSLQSENLATVAVVIQDINDQPPRFVCEQTNSSANSTCVFFKEIPENNPVGETIITLMVIDADEQSNISYSINSPDFTIDPSTGAVQAELSLDREKVDYFSLNVIANDGIFTAEAILNINITDVNDNSPVFSQEEYTITLTENYPVDVPFINVSATDLDVTDSVITYSILTSTLSPNVSINPSTGQISFTVRPDREATSTMELHLRAVDQGGRDDQATLVITLLDQNDEAPVFSMAVYTDTIQEELHNSIDLLHVSATDSDEGINRVIIYSLAEDSQQYFRINNATGLVSSKGPVDREVNQYFVLTVIARDLGNVSLSSQATVNITVSDINDNPPVLSNSSYTVSISESASTNTPVFTGQASDADMGSNAELFYQLTGNNSDDFQVTYTSEGDFTISTKQVLNFEVTQQYQLTLSVVDGGSPARTASAQITININDANDNDPVFNLASYKKTIFEDIPIQTTALTVTATDLDGTDTIIYSFLNPGEFPEFSLDSTTGDIIVVKSLDHETRTQYSIQVTARNERPGANTATATVMIILTDVNDNPPVIACGGATPSGEQCRQTISILENTPGSRILANFTATDADSVTNANAISFTIESGARPGLFQLTPFGQLSVLTSLDREQQASYLLLITASDNGSPPLTGTAYITIEVQDVNDNGPMGGTETIFIYHYAGSANPTTIGQVSGNDPDIINEHRFIINQENIPDLSVDENGLIVTTNTHLSPSDYSFLVTVTDTLFDGSVLSATSNVSIIVRDISDATLTNSFIMLFMGDSISQFLMNNLVKLRREISKVLKDSVTNFSEFYIFAVNRSELRSGVLEVSVVAVPSDDSYVQPDLVQHLIHRHQQQIEAVTNITIYTEDFTPCNNEPCATGGVCLSEIQYSPSENFVNTDMVTLLGLQKTWNVSCSCFPGFTGQTCSIPRPSCVNVTCLNGGHCIETDVITGCSCPHEYVGTRCEIKRNPPDLCRITTCDNGECSSSESGFTCTCPSDYTGKTCSEASQNSHGCFANVCRHGGTCVWDNSEQTTYTCQCPPGYSGINCQTRLYTETCDSSVAVENCQCVYTTSKSSCQFTQVCKMDSCEETQSCIQEQRAITCVDDCQPNPCSNGGTCIRQSPGYFCSCRDGFDGPKCELTTATFIGSASVLFPSVPLRGMEEITLDFITEQENGLLLLAGRLDNDTTDYLELEIFNGSLRLMTSLGGTSLSPLTMTNYVSDRQWHTVSIKYTTMNVELSLVTYEPYLYEIKTTQVLNHYFLDVNSPLVAGGTPEDTSYNHVPANTNNYIGCIRNLVVNGNTQDFSNALIRDQVTTGCSNTDRHCSSDSCAYGGKCTGLWSSSDTVNFECDCPPSRAGLTCRNPSISGSFDGAISIQLTIATQRTRALYSAGSTSLSLSFSTDASSGTILQFGDDESMEYAILEIINGYTQFRYNLGGGEAVARQHTVMVNNSYFHNTTVTRLGQSVTLLINNTYIATAKSPFSIPAHGTLDIDNTMIVMGASLLNTKHFQGCIRGLKINGNDVPLNGQNEHFTARPVGGQSVNQCPETLPTQYALPSLYIVIGAVFGSLVVTSILVLVTCKTTDYFYHRKRRVFSPSGRAQSFVFAPHAPSITNRGFYRVDGNLTIPNMHEGQELQSTTQSTPPSPSPSIPTTIAESNLNDPPYAVIPDKPVVKASPAKTRPIFAPTVRNHVTELSIPEPESQPQPRIRHASIGGESLKASPAKTRPIFAPTVRNHVTELSIPEPEPQPQPRIRHASIGGESLNSVTSSVMHRDRKEMAQFVKTRMKAVNSELFEISYDEAVLFKEEGPVEMMRSSSIASLHEIVKDFESEQQLAPITDRFNSLSQPQDFATDPTTPKSRHRNLINRPFPSDTMSSLSQPPTFDTKHVTPRSKRRLMVEEPLPPPPNYEEIKHLMHQFQKLAGDDEVKETRLV